MTRVHIQVRLGIKSNSEPVYCSFTKWANATQAGLSVLRNESPHYKPFVATAASQGHAYLSFSVATMPKPTTPWLLVPENSIIICKLLRSTVTQMKDGAGAAFSPSRIRCACKISKLFLFQKFFHLKRRVLTFLKKNNEFLFEKLF